MIYSSKHKFIFYPVPKTGSSSIWNVLRKQYAAVECPSGGRRGRHVMTLPEGDFDDYLFFTVVRHPLARAQSLWNHCCRLEGVKESLEDFVWRCLVGREDERFDWFCRTQTEWLDGLRLDHVLKLENIHVEFNALPFVCAAAKIPIINKGDRRDSTVTSKACLGVQKWAEEDFEKFGYVI